MSGLLVAALKVGFLLLMWLFILFMTLTIRTDMFGRRATAAELAEAGAATVPGGGRRGHRARAGASSAAPGEPQRIVVIAGRSTGVAVPLQGQVNLGRSADATLDLDDDYASSRHARLYRDEQSWIIEDLHSTNGTYVNGVRIQAPTRLGPDDLIRIGRTQLKLEL